jgi:hypothetical protein
MGELTPAVACTAFKNFYSTCLLIFSVFIVSALVFTKQTKMSQDVHPAAAFIIMWLAVLWLAMVEGGQGPLVGLLPVDLDLYKESHPKTYMSTKITTKGDNLDRYLMGRQFMVVLLVFVINLCGAPLAGATLFNFPSIVLEIFLVSGVAMILFTAMLGQLAAQVNASHMMLDFINNYFAVFTLYVAMVIEFSGFLHASYLIQMIVAKLAGKAHDHNSREEKRSLPMALFFWGRCLMSVAILGFACAVTFAALFQGKTTMWGSVPGGAAVVIFIILASCVGLLEGMQIAFFAVTKLPKSEQGKHKFAMKTCELLFRGEGVNLPGFMIGRQVCVTLCWFVAARVTTMNVVVGTLFQQCCTTSIVSTFFPLHRRNLFLNKQVPAKTFLEFLMDSRHFSTLVSLEPSLLPSLLPSRGSLWPLPSPLPSFPTLSYLSSSVFVCGWKLPESVLELGLLPGSMPRLLASSVTRFTLELPKSVLPRTTPIRRKTKISSLVTHVSQLTQLETITFL